MEYILESTSKSIKIRKQIQIQGGCNLRCICVAYKVPPRFVIIILGTLACFRSDLQYLTALKVRSDFLIALQKNKTNKKWEQAPALPIWLILGRNKKYLHTFPLSCLRGGILHAAVWFCLTQLVILLLWVLQCGFVNRVRVEGVWTQSFPGKKGMPNSCARPLWGAEQHPSTEPGSAAGAGSVSEGIFNVQSHLAGMTALPHGPTGSACPLHQPSELILAWLPPGWAPVVSLGALSGCAQWAPVTHLSPCPCAPWAMSHTASVPGKNLSLIP